MNQHPGIFLKIFKFWNTPEIRNHKSDFLESSFLQVFTQLQSWNTLAYPVGCR